MLSEYEHPLYQDFKVSVPALGCGVSTDEGVEGTVVGYNVPAQTVYVRDRETGRRVACPKASVCGSRQAYGEPSPTACGQPPTGRTCEPWRGTRAARRSDLVAACSADRSEAERESTSTPAPEATNGVDPALARFYSQQLAWETCHEDFQCTTVEVPLDYDAPDGEVIELAMLANLPVVTIGSVRCWSTWWAGCVGDRVRTDWAGRRRRAERFDVVGFDPGVGESAPIDCLDDAALDDFVETDGSPDDMSRDHPIAGTDGGVCLQCADRSGEMIPSAPSTWPETWTSARGARRRGSLLPRRVLWHGYRR